MSYNDRVVHRVAIVCRMLLLEMRNLLLHCDIFGEEKKLKSVLMSNLFHILCSWSFSSYQLYWLSGVHCKSECLSVRKLQALRTFQLNFLSLFKGTRLFLREDNSDFCSDFQKDYESDLLKMYWQLLKIFLSKSTG